MNLSASTGDPYQMKTDSAVAAACPHTSEMCATPIFVQHQIYARRSKLGFAKVQSSTTSNSIGNSTPLCREPTQS